MAHIFELVNQLFAQVVPVADFLWDFPTNIDAYANIPILGQLSIAFLLLLGGSLYFTLRFGFVQVKEFKTGIRLLTSKQQAKVGTSQLAAFLVSMGGRVGAGNIVGVTGAVTIGGPGAIFWMWIAAFLGMATEEDTDGNDDEATNSEERKASPKQIEILAKNYTGENLDKLLKMNGIEKLEDMTMTKASELIGKIISKRKGEKHD